MTDCIFCNIVAGEIPSKKLYEDDDILAFYDIEPKAPVHVLVIPKRHIDGADAVGPGDGAVIAHIFETIPTLAAQLGVADYRIVTNNGAGAGQTVRHLHFHLLAGAPLGEMC